MRKTLIKYKDIKLLVNEEMNIQHFIDNKDAIIQLNELTNQFCSDLLNQTEKNVEEINKLKQELSDFVMHSDAIGYQDAELYALNHNIEYNILEITD